MIYHFILLSDEQEDFFMEVAAHGKNTFLDLHVAISKALGYDQHYLASFIRTDEEWNRITEVTLIDMDNSGALLMEDLKIEEWCKTKGQQFIYLFDYIADRGLFIKLMDIKPSPDSYEKYPKILKLAGSIPSQIIEKHHIINDLLSGISEN